MQPVRHVPASQAVLGDYVQERRTSKAKRLEEKTTDAEEESGLAESGYFNEAVDSSGSSKLNASGEQFKSYFVEKHDFQISNSDNDTFDPTLLNQLFSSYIETAETDVLFEFFDKKSLSKKGVDELSDTLLSCDEDLADGELDSFIKNGGFNLAEIYTILTYLYEEISKKEQKKKKLLGLLQRLLATLGQQNSGYLFEFFNLANHPLVANNLKLANGIANLAAGNISSASIKDTIAFIREYLENDFTNLVSKCLRLRSHVLSRLTKTNVMFEDRQELSHYMKFEKNLITVNSIYLKLNNFNTAITKSKVWDVTLSDNYAEIISALLSFTELPMVTELAIKNLIRGLGIIKSPSQLTGFRNKIIQLLSGMPIVIFNNQDNHRQKIIQGLRNSFNHVKVETGEEKFTFIAPRKKLISYV